MTIAPINPASITPPVQPAAPAPAPAPATNDHDGDDAGGVRPAVDKGVGENLDKTA